MVRPGVKLVDLGKTPRVEFEKAGFVNKMEGNAPCGYIHGLGHGVGVDIHEDPPLNTRVAETELVELGQVFTIEPGLYYKSIGGCRIEDTLVVREMGAELLSAYDYDWIM